MPRAGSIPSAMHAGSTVQGVNFQAGVIGKTIHAVTFVNPPGFLPRIAFERIGILGYIVAAAYVIEAADIEGICGYGAEFFELMCVISGKYQCLHNDVLRVVVFYI